MMVERHRFLIEVGTKAAGNSLVPVRVDRKMDRSLVQRGEGREVAVACIRADIKGLWDIVHSGFRLSSESHLAI
jgi:hypothetical protein